MGLLRNRHMERLRLVHYVCSDCIYKTTNEQALRVHLQMFHHDPIDCPHASCGVRFDRVSECTNHIAAQHPSEAQALYSEFARCCNRPYAKMFKYNAYQYNPTKEYYIEFISDDFLRIFYGYLEQSS